MNNKRGQNFKYLPFAFTELGVAMLSSVLRSKTAIKVNRDIMRAFVAFRRITSIPDTSERFERIENEINWLSCSPESRSHGGVSDLFEMRRERKRRTLPDPLW